MSFSDVIQIWWTSYVCRRFLFVCFRNNFWSLSLDWASLLLMSLKIVIKRKQSAGGWIGWFHNRKYNHSRYRTTNFKKIFIQKVIRWYFVTLILTKHLIFLLQISNQFICDEHLRNYGRKVPWLSYKINNKRGAVQVWWCCALKTHRSVNKNVCLAW